VVAHRIDPEVRGEQLGGDLGQLGQPFALLGTSGDHRLGQLLTADEQPAVDEDVRRWVDARRHAHRRPPHTVEAEDLLADQVVDGGPPFLEALLVVAVAMAVR